MREQAIKYLHDLSMVDLNDLDIEENQKWMIWFWKITHSYELHWRHQFCTEWIQGYVKSKIEQGIVIDLLWPIDTCQKFIKDEFVIQLLQDDPRLTKKFKYFLKHMKIASENEICLFCPNCNIIWYTEFDYDEQVIECNNCEYKFYASTLSKYNPESTLDEDTELYYKQVISKKSIQLCPNCSSYVTKSKVCNHMNWIKCSFTFCMYWRSKYSHNHLNPLNDKSCPSLLRSRSKRIVSKMPAVVSSSWKFLTCMLMLFLLISPFLALTTVPYIIYKNYKSNKPNNCSTNMWAFGLVLLLIIWFPVTWIFSIITIFVLYWQMLKI